MTTGITKPASALVAALNSLQKPMMLTPCWPSAGPTGGAGFAWPAGICNLICPMTFFAIKFFFVAARRAHPAIFIQRRSAESPLQISRFLHLPILQFHRRISSENVHGHFQLAAFRINFLDHAAEVQE